MHSEKRILIVDDDKDILVAGELLLKRHFGDVVTCSQPEHIPRVMAEQGFDAVLLDMNFSPGDSSGEQGFIWLRRILALDPDAVLRPEEESFGTPRIRFSLDPPPKFCDTDWTSCCVVEYPVFSM